MQGRLALREHLRAAAAADALSPTQREPGMSDLEAARALMVEADQLRASGAPDSEIESRLLAALDLTGEDSWLKFSCTFGLAQLVGERALDVDTDDLVRALGLARAAEHAGRDGVVPDDVYTKALSVLGRALVRVSSRLAEPASSECARRGKWRSAKRSLERRAITRHTRNGQGTSPAPSSASLTIPLTSRDESPRRLSSFVSLSIPTLL